MRNILENFTRKAKRWKSSDDLDKPMLKFQFLALSGLVFIHGANNMTILILLLATVSRNAKLSIVLFLISSNIIIYLILKKYGKVWFK